MKEKHEVVDRDDPVVDNNEVDEAVDEIGEPEGPTASVTISSLEEYAATSAINEPQGSSNGGFGGNANQLATFIQQVLLVLGVTVPDTVGEVTLLQAIASRHIQE